MFLIVTGLRREVIPLFSAPGQRAASLLADRASKSPRQASPERDNCVLTPLTGRFEVDSFVYGREGGKGGGNWGIPRGWELSDDGLLTLSVPGMRQTAAARSWGHILSRGRLYASRLGQKSFFLVFYPAARQQSREMAVSGLEGTAPQNGMRWATISFFPIWAARAWEICVMFNNPRLPEPREGDGD